MALLVHEDGEAEGEALHPSGREPELVWPQELEVESLIVR